MKLSWAEALCANSPATTSAMSLTFIFVPISAHEVLAKGGRRRVAAVDLPVAFGTASTYEADVRRQRVGQRPASVVDAVRVAVRVAVAAEHRRLLHEQRPVRRAVRRVADGAVLFDRGMLVDPRAALVGMAAGAQVVGRVVAQARLLQRTVRVMAVLAADLAFDDRVVRRLDELAADVGVA